MEEVLLDAIGQFMQGEGWRKPINQFIIENSHLFRDTDAEEYQIEQYDVFLQYGKLVEELVEGIVKNLGCDSEMLLSVLQERSTETKELLDMILANDNYPQFHAMMIAGPSTSQPTTASDPSAEYVLQEAVAKSLLEAHELGQLDNDEEELLGWAQAVMEMKALNEQYQDGQYNESIEEADCDKKMRELELKLNQEKLKVDLLVAQRMSESNAMLRAQVFHSANEQYQEGMVDDDYDQEFAAPEEELTSLLERSAECRKELENVKNVCFQYENIPQHSLDEIYLFLKEKVHHKKDLAVCQQEIYDFIFARIYSEDATVVPSLLQWLLLESEELDIKYRIDSLLNGEVQAEGEVEYWTQAWDDESSSHYYLNTKSGESVWEEPTEYWGIDEQWHSRKVDEETAQDHELLSLQREATVKAEQAQHDLTDIGNALEAALGLCDDHETTDDEMKKNMELELERISKEHDEERRRLEITLQVEKARQAQELQRRKEKRRKDRQRRKKLKEKKLEREGSTETTTAVLVPPNPVSLGPKITPINLPNGSNLPAVPGQEKRQALAALLTKADALRRQGTESANPSGTLNSTSLRFLAEKAIIRKPAWTDEDMESSKPEPVSSLS